MNHKRIRPKEYVRIKFKPHGQRSRWYWAIKIKKGLYKRVHRDGDTVMKERVRREDGATIQTEEMLIGIPLEEIPAVMNLHYAELEEE